MLRNYLTTALRQLRRQKGYSFINVFGLTIGLTCCIFIFQYVAFEYSFDRFHEDAETLYRVTMAPEGQEGGQKGAFTPHALKPSLEEAIPELKNVTRLHPEFSSPVVANPDQPGKTFKFKDDEVLYADPAFLKMFTFPLVAGSEKTALRPGTMLISESMAQTYFGTTNPVGKSLEVAGMIDKSYEVTGVFEDVPPNSHLQFKMLLPMRDLLQENYSEASTDWSRNNFLTYIQLYSEGPSQTVGRKMTELYADRAGDFLRQVGAEPPQLGLQPLRDIHLNADVQAIATVMGSYQTVYFSMVVGLVTLLIALLNYVNLSTARSLDRAREVGVRKAIGARPSQLIRQFLFESALTNLLAAVLAAGLAALLTPVVNNLIGTQLTGDLWLNPWFWGIFLTTFGVGTLLAGLYPAFVLSSFSPASVMRGQSGSGGGHLWLRRGLVVLQFAASFVLAAGTVVAYNQLDHMQNMDLGLNVERVLAVEGPQDLPEGRDLDTAISTFVQELRQLPAVEQVANSTTVPGDGFSWNGASVRRATEDPATSINSVITWVDTSFADLYGMKLAAGRGFTEATISGAGEEPWPVVANETAVRNLGYKSPRSAVGRRIAFGDNQARIIGVYKDFNWTSAHQQRQNIFFRYASQAGFKVSVRVKTRDLSGTIASIRETYTSLFPGNPFGYNFVDQLFHQQYQQDRRFARLFTVFAALAILIACLGLLGLAAFAAQKRTGEIGIRKALGASMTNIVMLLAKDFVALVAVACVIAVPVAYVVLQRWLQSFAYRIEISPLLFLYTAGSVLLVALLTVSYKAIQAARIDPAKAVRYE